MKNKSAMYHFMCAFASQTQILLHIKRVFCQIMYPASAVGLEHNSAPRFVIQNLFRVEIAHIFGRQCLQGGNLKTAQQRRNRTMDKNPPRRHTNQVLTSCSCPFPLRDSYLFLRGQPPKLLSDRSFLVLLYEFLIRYGQD